MKDIFTMKIYDLVVLFIVMDVNMYILHVQNYYKKWNLMLL